MSSLIGDDSPFKFSLIADRIGNVTYISGVEARDYGGFVWQRMISLHATGDWSTKGLKICLSGELGDLSAPPSTSIEFKKESYEIELEIPWSILRFLFYNQMDFLISHYERIRKECP
jgi:hypothetical protein